MGQSENHTESAGKQGERKRFGGRRPRRRRCLLKGCERRFGPRGPQQRYCSPECRKAARDWSRWKAQQRYRKSEHGRQQRKRQSCRYRECVREREERRKAGLDEAARVITVELFRPGMRPSGMLRKVRSRAAQPAATVLFGAVPAGVGARAGAGTALAQPARRISGGCRTERRR